MCESVSVLPAAFDSAKNPKAADNIKQAEAASKRLEDVVHQKAEFLRELVDEYFLGFSGVTSALAKVLKGRGEEEIDKTLEELAEGYEKLQKEHTDAGEALIASYRM